MGGETIAVFTKNRVNPAYEAARLGADRAAARLRARTVHYVPRTPDCIQEQAALVERAIAERPDAVLFVPVHDSALDGAVRQLNEAGIPAVNYLNRLARGRFVTFVGADDYRLGRDIAACLFRHLGGAGRVLLMAGMPGSVTSRERLRGYRDEAREWTGIALAGECCGRYEHAEAARATADFLARGDALHGILCANDAMALGALEAIEASGRHVAVTGVNALPDAIAAVRCGRLLATADFDTMKIACIAAEAALRHVRGAPVPPEIILPAAVVNRTNCHALARPPGERECPDWEEIVRRNAEL